MLDTFHPFPNLPTELRLYIWSLSLLNIGDRIVIATCRRHHREGRYSWYFCAKLPAQLHASREARQEALRVYTPHFRIEPTVNSAPRSYVYLAPERDIVRLNQNALLHIGEADLKILRRVILDINYNPKLLKLPWIALRKMERLEKLDLLIWQTSGHQIHHSKREIVLNIRQQFVAFLRYNPRWNMPEVRFACN
ncbi:2EXR domain-containing protein [Aspergillus ibericus CBS 121593]|uniref:2EXR domain-containing protein n=1 Tax=Aspergillus ibericus CBS 121593 TaxID=1448316 RepID=A0A395GTX8_9EURO|nr:hypothetical protein BO80DRAFT_448180 [Aspergillus ibericus CBS 121593]RAK97563.1 hypothetical protein BO80DRAFT_448180 [Aspergillus ibericus CBS 121593]